MKREGPQVLIGIAAEAAGEGKAVNVIVRGSAKLAPDEAGMRNVGALMSIAREFGMELPQGFVFEAGQVFYTAGQVDEVRLRGHVVGTDQPPAPWERSRVRGAELVAGPRVHVRDGELALSLDDQGRTHMTAHVVDTPDGPAILLLWDLAANGQRAEGIDRALCLRIPQSVAVAFASTRGGELQRAPLRWHDRSGKTFPTSLDLRRWTFVPPRGATLVLPFGDETAHGITIERSGPIVREVLSGGSLRSYLATWALWAEQGCNAEGAFALDTNQIADLCGLEVYENKSGGGASYGKALQDFRAAVEHLHTIGLAAVGDVEARSAEPLIQEWREKSRPNRRLYLHARLALAALRQAGDFAQLPRNVLRLSARDTPIALGVATLWREEITRTALAPGAPGYWRGSLRDFAQKTGVYNEREAQKKAGSYWRPLAADIIRIVAQGELGTAHVEGSGPRAIVTLEPSPVLARAYVPLLDAQREAAARAERRADEVAIRKALGQGRRKGRK